MKFLIDENIGLDIALYLRSKGHDVALVTDHGFSIKDPIILDRAQREGRIIITHDLDFGQLVFEKLKQHAGVILLRLKINTVKNHIEVLRAFLALHDESEITNQFWSLD